MARINMELILGIGCLNTPQNDAQQAQPRRNPHARAREKGKTRLLQILVPESAHLIWALRCERIVHEEIYPDEEIKARWLRKISEGTKHTQT